MSEIIKTEHDSQDVNYFPTTEEQQKIQSTQEKFLSEIHQERPKKS